MIRSLCELVVASGITIRLPLGSVTSAVIAPSISAALRTEVAIGFTANDGAAAIAGLKKYAPLSGETSGLNTSATRVIRGAIPLSSSNHLALMVDADPVNP